MVGTPDSIFIGYGHFAVEPFVGRIDDVRVYNRALTAAEMQQLYSMGR